MEGFWLCRRCGGGVGVALQKLCYGVEKNDNPGAQETNRILSILSTIGYFRLTNHSLKWPSKTAPKRLAFFKAFQNLQSSINKIQNTHHKNTSAPRRPPPKATVTAAWSPLWDPLSLLHLATAYSYPRNGLLCGPKRPTSIMAESSHGRQGPPEQAEQALLFGKIW